MAAASDGRVSHKFQWVEGKRRSPNARCRCDHLSKERWRWKLESVLKRIRLNASFKIRPTRGNEIFRCNKRLLLGPKALKCFKQSSAYRFHQVLVAIWVQSCRRRWRCKLCWRRLWDQEPPTSCPLRNGCGWRRRTVWNRHLELQVGVSRDPRSGGLYCCWSSALCRGNLGTEKLWSACLMESAIVLSQQTLNCDKKK